MMFPSRAKNRYPWNFYVVIIVFYCKLTILSVIKSSNSNLKIFIGGLHRGAEFLEFYFWNHLFTLKCRKIRSWIEQSFGTKKQFCFMSETHFKGGRIHRTVAPWPNEDIKLVTLKISNDPSYIWSTDSKTVLR